MAKRFFVCGAVGWGEPAWQPPADLFQIDREWILRLELAGVRPEDIDVTVNGPVLDIAGVRRDLLVPLQCNVHSMEIPFSRFRRTISLPFDLRAAQIHTEYNYGMLLIRISPEEEHE